MEAVLRRAGLLPARTKRSLVVGSNSGDPSSTHASGRGASVGGTGSQSARPIRPQPIYVNVQHISSRASVASHSSGGGRRRRRRRHRGAGQAAARRSGQPEPRSDAGFRQRAFARLRMLNLRLFDGDTAGKTGNRTRGNLITRRLCKNRREDNELYRSNSFKFERFERQDVMSADTALRIRRQISLCDDYSLPVDFVTRRFRGTPEFDDQSNALPPQGVTFADEQVVEVLETYSDPKDTKQRPHTVYKQQQQPRQKEEVEEILTEPASSIQRYSRTTYSGGSSEPRSSNDEYSQSIDRVPCLNSPDSITGDLAQRFESPSQPRQTITHTKRDPSPYYYSDLLRARCNEVLENNIRRRDSSGSDSSCSECTRRPIKPMPPHRDRYEDEEDLDPTSLFYLLGGHDMTTSTRRLYETAFDCRVSRTEEDLDAVTNRTVLLHQQQRLTTPAHRERRKNRESTRVPVRELKALHIVEPTEGEDRTREYEASPPSTAPLPTKFHGRELLMNSIRSAPDLQPRLKDLRLPVKSAQYKARHERVMEIKGRPKSEAHKFSSTESMTASSSGGSMDSLRSSTSEGNRSSTSSDSRRSSSLSSHSSDSGQNQAHVETRTRILHILSPISDKSSQEQASETSDNNRNNNSQKASPDEDVGTTAENISNKNKRRPQNKTLMSTKHEILGSDSGISIRSRDGGSAFRSFASLKTGGQQLQGDTRVDLQPLDSQHADLPFDMPKLRRRRAQQQQIEACTSGSATSVDLRDLPFDMPKLRRRLRGNAQHTAHSTESSGVSQASSSQSVREGERPSLGASMFREKLTLNLRLEGAPKSMGLELGPRAGSMPRSLNLNLGLSNPGPVELVDSSIPLERQGWYHGAITRVEAEAVLRLAGEGGFLVRNSESTRQDYSLSLKSVRGFMHMRIQRQPDSGYFVLGQFSKPFPSIPEIIQHFCKNRLPVRGAEHMCLLQPVNVQLL